MVSPPHPAIEIEHLTRHYGSVKALDDVCLTVEQGEFFSLLGPSGCGKTTLLRIIAGLEAPDSGRIRIGGSDADGVAAYRRPVNTVFQSYALFPHLTVWDNVAFGLRMKRVPKPEIEQRVAKVMNLVEIESLGARRPAQLSGGQKQRVALARAIVNEPQVLLLDEPLGALDLKLRKQLQLELLNLQRRLRLTFIYVTHDQEEALVLSDRIAVMRDGKLEQVGRPETLYEKPRTRFVSQFLGSCTLLDVVLPEAAGGERKAQSPIGLLRFDGTPPSRLNFTLAIRPEKVQLSFVLKSVENQVPVRVEQVIYVGSETHYELRSGRQQLRAEVMNNQDAGRAFQAGQDVYAYLPPNALIILDD